ncbi:MAG TPA: hypothetical protein VGV36_09500, partial [Solirubrobacteraceae bacterium]|nr:hypothetical protein [Solirubrobacteraceae bacterium]
MPDRRRNLFVLLLVFGLLLGSGIAVAVKETRLGLDLSGGVELVYQASPTPAEPVIEDEAIERAIDVMRDRVDSLGVSEPEIQRSGEAQISVALPGVADTERAAEQVGQVAQLFFYDWEANVVGPDGKVGSQNPDVTGGQAAGSLSSGIELYSAVLRAKGVEPERDRDNTHNGLFYLLDREAEEVVAGPEESREELLETARAPQPLPANLQVQAIPPGVVSVKAEAPPNIDPDQVGRFYVLRYDPALNGEDIRDPQQAFDQWPGSSGQPIVTFDFTEQGRAAWE